MRRVHNPGLAVSGLVHRDITRADEREKETHQQEDEARGKGLLRELFEAEEEAVEPLQSFVEVTQGAVSDEEIAALYGDLVGVAIKKTVLKRPA
jgi:hypothetical protein